MFNDLSMVLWSFYKVSTSSGIRSLRGVSKQGLTGFLQGSLSSSGGMLQGFIG